MLWRGWPHLGACTGETASRHEAPSLPLQRPRRLDRGRREILGGQTRPVEESLKAEMRRSLVYSVAERGIDEDEGRGASHLQLSRAPGPWW
jgi:hypothetical protein